MATAAAFPISVDSKILAGAKALAPRNWASGSWASAMNAGLGARRPLDAETSLIERCLSGEQGAWEDLVKLYTKRVYGICYRFTGRDNEAQDLTQDVFLRVFKTLGSFRAGEGSFVVWLTRLTRNLLVDHYRRTKHDRVTDAIEDKLATLEERTAQSSRTDGLLAGREAGELLQAALQKLSPELAGSGHFAGFAGDGVSRNRQSFGCSRGNGEIAAEPRSRRIGAHFETKQGNGITTTP